MMAGSDSTRTTLPSPTAAVSARVGGDLARRAKSVQELALVIRSLEGAHDQAERLRVPIQAYLASIYGYQKPPRLTVDIEDSSELAPDWMIETALLQIVQEARHNVRQHSHATTVEVAIETSGGRVVLRVTDDGTGFDCTAVPEGPGIATMRAATAVSEGTLVIDSRPGRGTAVLAYLGPDRPVGPAPRRVAQTDSAGRSQHLIDSSGSNH